MYTVYLDFENSVDDKGKIEVKNGESCENGCKILKMKEPHNLAQVMIEFDIKMTHIRKKKKL